MKIVKIVLGLFGVVVLWYLANIVWLVWLKPDPRIGRLEKSEAFVQEQKQALAGRYQSLKTKRKSDVEAFDKVPEKALWYSLVSESIFDHYSQNQFNTLHAKAKELFQQKKFHQALDAYDDVQISLDKMSENFDAAKDIYLVKQRVEDAKARWASLCADQCTPMPPDIVQAQLFYIGANAAYDDGSFQRAVDSWLRAEKYVKQALASLEKSQ